MKPACLPPLPPLCVQQGCCRPCACRISPAVPGHDSVLEPAPTPALECEFPPKFQRLQPPLPQVMTKPVNANQRRDSRDWLPGVKPGEVCAGPNNPLVWEHGSA